nr:hypothetical protein [Delftia acidovorans]
MSHVTIPVKWLNELLDLCGPEDHELRERVMKSAAPAAPAVDASDTALLDAMERERIAVIPEFEGPWDAQIFGEDESTLACGSGATPRKAIAEALVSLEARKAHDAAQAKEGGAPVADAAPLDVCTDPYNCARCKTHPAHRGDMHHAGISRIGGSA